MDLYDMASKNWVQPKADIEKNDLKSKIFCKQ